MEPIQLTPVPVEFPELKSSRIDETQAPEGASFGDTLNRAWTAVNRQQNEKDAAVETLATGRTPDIHNTMIAVQKADISFNLMMQVRNKIVAAYEEIMRMQV